jgi:Clp amino terminal domain, pathogenicity island component
MIELDVADLVVITGPVLGTGADTALGQLDIAAAQAALAEARPTVQEQASTAGSRAPEGPPRPAAAAAAATALMHALLRHHPVPGHGGEVATAAGLQFLALNGWQADMDVPPAAAIIIQRLAAGQLTPDGAASWLAPRLSRHPEAPASEEPRRAARRLTLAPVAALRRRHRRHSRLGPVLVISLGSAGEPAGIRTPATGLMPITGHALNSVVLSGQEARRRGQPRGPEHFLLGLTADSGSIAATALQRLGISPEAARQQAEQITSQAGLRPRQGRIRRIPVIPEARRTWNAILDEAVAHGHDYIGTEHILLAIFSDQDGAAAQALTGLGAGENEIRSAIAALLAETGREHSA